MARPDVAATAELLYAALGPLAEVDSDTNDWAVLRLCDAMCAGTFDDIHVLVSEGDTPGWQILLDPDEVPAVYLPYVAQFAGVELKPEWTEQEQRDAIKLPAGFMRGSGDLLDEDGVPDEDKGAIRQAVKRTLTGTKTVIIRERTDGDTEGAYRLWVRTLDSETPNPGSIDLVTGTPPAVGSTAEAVLSQKPVGIVAAYEAVTGQTWADLVEDYATWQDVIDDYATWTLVIADLPDDP